MYTKFNPLKLYEASSIFFFELKVLVYENNHICYKELFYETYFPITETLSSYFQFERTPFL